MANADRFIDKGSVQWGGLLSAIFGGWALAAGEGTARVFMRFWTEIVAAQLGIRDFYLAMLAIPFAPFQEGATIATAWTETAEIANAMGPVGVLLFAGELILLAWIVEEGIERVV